MRFEGIPVVVCRVSGVDSFFGRCFGRRRLFGKGGSLFDRGGALLCVRRRFFSCFVPGSGEAAGAMEEAVKKVEAGKVDGRRERRLEEWLFCS